MTRLAQILLKTLLLLFAMKLTIGCSDQPPRIGTSPNGIVAKVIQRCDIEEESIVAASITAYLLVPQDSGESKVYPMTTADDSQSAAVDVELTIGMAVTVEIRAIVSAEQTTLAAATRTVEQATISEASLDFRAIDFELSDEDNNGRPDCSEFLVAADGSLSWPPACGSELGTDANSSTPSWDDNCTVRRSSMGGVFADSLYAVGIQRVVYCSGFGEGTTYINFADGEYGPASEAAVREFQLSEPGVLSGDGIVGFQTWFKLQSRIVMIEEEGEFQENTEGAMFALRTYGFNQGRCAGIPLFYQTVYRVDDSESRVLGEWTLARNQPYESEQVPFSIASNLLLHER